MPLEPGLRGRVAHTVTEADTAVAQGSGDVPVLATPRIVAICERATVEALGCQLGADTTSVGMRVQIDHTAPTPVGVEVVAEALLEKVEGRRLTFLVRAVDGDEEIASGRVTRVLVDRDRFLDRVYSHDAPS